MNRKKRHRQKQKEKHKAEQRDQRKRNAWADRVAAETDTPHSGRDEGRTGPPAAEDFVRRQGAAAVLKG